MWIISIITYYTLTLSVKYIIFKKMKLNPTPSYNYKHGRELSIFLSPDLWFATRFKNAIKYDCAEPTDINLADFVKKNNTYNLALSLCLALIAFFSFDILNHEIVFNFAYSIVAIRFISRSGEIGYAFYRDAIQSTKSFTNLDKYDRIKLALKSYVEIYIYSAPVYLLLPNMDTIKAITLSLNVGSLTNVGMAFSEDTSAVNLTVFIQVFTTLCLVILSLASYISRPNTNE